jgi:hypothetical protein
MGLILTCVKGEKNIDRRSEEKEKYWKDNGVKLVHAQPEIKQLFFMMNIFTIPLRD